MAEPDAGPLHRVARGRFTMYRCAMPGVAAVEAATRYSFARHTHEQFGIGVVLQGAQRSASGRGPVEAGVGDVITVNPGEVHDGAPIGQAGRTWRILYFDPEVILDGLRDLHDGAATACELAYPVIRNAGIADRVHHLFSCMTGGGGTLEQEQQLLALLAAVLEQPDRVAGRPALPAAIARARSLIDDDPARPVTLAELARESGLSRFQVLRAFVRGVGLTPHAYLVQRRIDLARRLIAGGMALAEASAAAGFADQSHMTRVFVRKYGVSPGVFAAAAGCNFVQDRRRPRGRG